MLDKYIIGSVDRISPEAPIPIVKVTEEKNIPGGASNVANNIASLGGKVRLLGYVGDDVSGILLKKKLREISIDCSGLITAKNPTIQKIRVMAGQQQLVRIDYENTKHFDSYDVVSEDNLCRAIESSVPDVDIIIVSDYAKGCINEKIMDCLKYNSKKQRIALLIDPKLSNKHLYKDCFLIKPNQKETEELSGIKLDSASEEDLISAGRKIMEEFSSNVLITRGSKGMTLFENEKGRNEYFTIPTKAKEVCDVSGAGDTFMSALALSIGSGASLVESAEIANHAAGIVVGKIGTATLTKDELLAAFESENKKIVNLDKLKMLISYMRSKEKCIVFANGCFDILHSGHIQLLKKAKSFGNILVVALNSDVSVRRLKGKNRPILSQDERVEIIAALEFVDYVMLFDDDTPSRILSEIQPDIVVKGKDYIPQDYQSMPEARIIKEYGGKIELVDMIEGKSTTELINRIKK
jgi:D-beta-D-heptose 7-phosphate kinase/D-beta-D-heptose 1-phosphate adenosyltransferase